MFKGIMSDEIVRSLNKLYLTFVMNEIGYGYLVDDEFDVDIYLVDELKAAADEFVTNCFSDGFIVCNVAVLDVSDSLCDYQLVDSDCGRKTSFVRLRISDLSKSELAEVVRILSFSWINYCSFITG